MKYHTSPSQVWNTGCNLSIAFLVSFICFYKALRGVLLDPTLMPAQFAHTFPLLLLLYMLHCFLVRQEKHFFSPAGLFAFLRFFAINSVQVCYCVRVICLRFFFFPFCCFCCFLLLFSCLFLDGWAKGRQTALAFPRVYFFLFFFSCSQHGASQYLPYAHRSGAVSGGTMLFS